MRFLDVHIQNFLSFGPLQRVPLANQGLVAVLGQNNDSGGADSNGAGKSTVLESLVWVLYGETMRGYRGDDVINNREKKECVVTLRLEDDDGHLWEVCRTRGIKAKKPNDLQLTVNGQPPAQQGGVVPDTQEQVITLLGMDKDTFVHSVLMCYGAKPFAELTDGQQKSAIEAILPIGHLPRARDLVAARVRAAQNKLAAVNTELEQVNQQVTQVTDRHAKLASSLREHEVLIKQRRVELQRKKAACEQRIEDELHSEGLDKMLDAMKDMDVHMTEYRRREDAITPKLLAAQRNGAQQRSELLQQKAVLEAQRHGHTRDCETVNQLTGKPCPTCKRLLDPQASGDLLDVWDAQIQTINGQLQTLYMALDEIDTTERNQTRTLEADRQLVRAESETLQAQQRILHAKIQQRSATLQLICQLEQQAFNIQEEIEKLDAEVNPYAPLVEEAARELINLQERLRRLQFRQQSLDMAIRHLLFWEHGFGNQGVKSFIIEGILPVLSERAQHYADMMSDGDWQISFTAQRQLKSGALKEEFETSVRNRHGAEVYKGNSDGEKRRINTAIAWAFGDLAAARAKKSIRFRALDEPFENLDETGEDAVVKLLHAVLPRYETIFCVTHSDHLKNQFPKVMTVIKEGGYSRIA